MSDRKKDDYIGKKFGPWPFPDYGPFGKEHDQQHDKARATKHDSEPKRRATERNHKEKKDGK